MSSKIPARGQHVPKNKTSGTNARRVLAVDYGRKKIGLAISDELGITAQPLVTVKRENRAADLRRLRQVCREHEIGHIIVGLPLHMTGEAGEMAAEAAAFARRLEKAVGLRVELVDERLTSWEARQTMSNVGSAPRGKRRALDHVAAAVLLRDYLEAKRGEAAQSTSTETD
jgi:putative holliday junction resolvase